MPQTEANQALQSPPSLHLSTLFLRNVYLCFPAAAAAAAAICTTKSNKKSIACGFLKSLNYTMKETRWRQNNTNTTTRLFVLFLCCNECKLERLPGATGVTHLHLDGNVITSLTLRRLSFVWISIYVSFGSLSPFFPQQGSPGCCWMITRRGNTEAEWQ